MQIASICSATTQLCSQNAAEKPEVKRIPAQSLPPPLAEDDDVIETVAPDAAEKSLANRIHERSLDCRPKNAHAGALCCTVEVCAELAVVVSNDELGPDAEGVASR